MKSRLFKLLIWGSLLINVILLASFVRQRIYFHQQNKNAIPWADIWNKDRVDVFSTLPIDSNDIVFVGNSLTDGFPFKEIFPALSIKNRGITGNESRHVLGRIGAIISHHPKKLFLEIGVNDLNTNVSEDTVMSNYIKIINLIKSGGIYLYVQSLFPTCMEYDKLNPSIVSLNKRLKAYCNQTGTPYIDLYDCFYKRGGLDSSLTYDGIHLSGRGYHLWGDKLIPYLAQ